MNNNLYNKIITDVSKIVKKAINEAFDFGTVNKVHSTKILTNIAMKEAMKFELLHTDILKVIEGLYGIVKPRGFYVDNIAWSTLGEYELPAIMTIKGHNGKADRELRKDLEKNNFYFINSKPYPLVTNGITNVRDYICNTWTFKQYDTDRWQEVLKGNISIPEYKQAIKKYKDEQEKVILNSIKSWEEKYNKLSDYVKDIYNSFEDKTIDCIGISEDEGIIYISAGEYNDENPKRSILTFTGKVFYKVEELISDNDSKQLNATDKLKKKKFTCLNKALRKNKYSLAYNSLQLLDDEGKPVFRDFFLWNISVERNKPDLKAKGIPYADHEMELRTQKNFWHRVIPTNGADYEHHTNDGEVYYRVYNCQDKQELIKSWYNELNDDRLKRYIETPTGNLTKVLADAYTEIGLTEKGLENSGFYDL